VRSNLIASIAAEYYALLLLDKQLQIGESTVEVWKETEKALEALRLQDRNYNETALLQAQAQRLALESTILSIKQSIVERENEICSMVATPPMKILRGSLDEQVTPKDLSDSVSITLLYGRPDVKSALYKYASAYYAVNQAWSYFFPSIYINGNNIWMNNLGVSIADPSTWLISAIGSISKSLIAGGTNKARLKIAKSDRAIAELEYRQSILNAGKEVNNALSSISTANSKIAIDTEQVKTLELALDKTEVLMKYSTANYLEVLSARQSLLTANNNLAIDRYDEICAVISLYKALGGGSK